MHDHVLGLVVRNVVGSSPVVEAVECVVEGTVVGGTLIPFEEALMYFHQADVSILTLLTWMRNHRDTIFVPCWMPQERDWKVKMAPWMCTA